LSFLDGRRRNRSTLGTTAAKKRFVTDLSDCLVVHHATQHNLLSPEDILSNRDTTRFLLHHAAGHNSQCDVIIRDLVGIKGSLTIRPEQLTGSILGSASSHPEPFSHFFPNVNFRRRRIPDAFEKHAAMGGGPMRDRPNERTSGIPLSGKFTMHMVRSVPLPLFLYGSRPLRVILEADVSLG
jgi:hypothetical protein